MEWQHKNPWEDSRIQT